jgi:amino acid adenylation domain-containing protein
MDGSFCDASGYTVNGEKNLSRVAKRVVMEPPLQNGLRILPDISLPLEKIWQGSVLRRFHQHEPDRIAIETAQEHWSYRELDRASGNLGRFLSASKSTDEAQPGTNVVAVYAKRSAALVVALLGIVRAGCAFVILDPKYPGNRLAKCVKLAQPIGLLNIGDQALAVEIREVLNSVGISFLADLPESKAKLLAWHHDGSSDEIEDPEIAPDDTLYLAFTSGTTGLPRMVEGSHCPVSHFFEWQRRTFELGSEDRIGMLSGLSHDPLLRDVFMPLWVGATICVPEQDLFEMPKALFEWIRRDRISVAHMTPSIGHLLLTGVEERKEESLPDLRYAFFGGDVLRYKTVRRLAARAPNATIVNFYGTTETPQVAAFCVVNPKGGPVLPSEQFPGSMVPLGRGIDNSQLIILDGKERLCQPGEIGEICIRSPYLAKRIVDESDLHRNVQRPNESVSGIEGDLYRTGDLGYYLSDGSAMFEGRNDRQIKLRGYRIELSEIDEILASDESVLEHYIDVEGERDEEKRIVLYAVRRGGPFRPAEDLRERLAANLPGFMVPSRIVEVSRLPVTANGKIDKGSLRAMRQERSENSVDSRSGIAADPEVRLVMILRDLLCDQRIGPGDRIKDLGMNSLQAVSVSCGIQRAFEVSLSIGEILECEDIRSLVRAVADRQPMATTRRADGELVGPGERKKQQKNARPESTGVGKPGEHLGPPRLIPKDENIFVGTKNRVLQLLARVAPDVLRRRLHQMRGVTIGKEVSVGYDTVIETAFPWLVRIGDRVNIGMRCTIIAHFRGMASISRGQFTVDIRDDAFIGPGVIILPNVTIGEGAVVAAGSVVNHSVPPYVLVHGNPAIPRARCGVALTGTTEYQEFIGKLDPIQNDC